MLSRLQTERRPTDSGEPQCGGRLVQKRPLSDCPAQQDEENYLDVFLLRFYSIYIKMKENKISLLVNHKIIHQFRSLIKNSDH